MRIASGRQAVPLRRCAVVAALAEQTLRTDALSLAPDDSHRSRQRARRGLPTTIKPTAVFAVAYCDDVDADRHRMTCTSAAAAATGGLTRRAATQNPKYRATVWDHLGCNDPELTVASDARRSSTNRGDRMQRTVAAVLAMMFAGTAAAQQQAAAPWPARAQAGTVDVGAEALVWWLRDSPAPVPLVTNRIVGLPDTQTYLGGQDLSTGATAGLRLTAGYALSAPIKHRGKLLLPPVPFDEPKREFLGGVGLDQPDRPVPRREYRQRERHRDFVRADLQRHSAGGALHIAAGRRSERRVGAVGGGPLDASTSSAASVTCASKRTTRSPPAARTSRLTRPASGKRTTSSRPRTTSTDCRRACARVTTRAPSSVPAS